MGHLPGMLHGEFRWGWDCLHLWSSYQAIGRGNFKICEPSSQCLLILLNKRHSYAHTKIFHTLMYFQYFNAPFSQVSIIGSVTGTMAFAWGPLSSFLVNRFGSRPVCIAGGLMCGTGMVSILPFLLFSAHEKYIFCPK